MSTIKNPVASLTDAVADPDKVLASHLANQVDRLMRRINAGLHHRAEAVDTDKVGPLGGMLLLAVQDAEPVPIQQLVAMMGRDKSQMTRLIQMLERKGYLERQPSPSDGRVSLLNLSNKGATFVGTIQGILADVVDEVLDPLDAQERQLLVKLLHKV